MREKPRPFVGGSGKGPNRRIGVDTMDGPQSKRHMIPVWFFVGVILLIYGVLILATGLYELSHPPSTVLAELRPAIWWGALLTVIGAIYVYLFLPRGA
jgi:hypothetical protein